MSLAVLDSAAFECSFKGRLARCTSLTVPWLFAPTSHDLLPPFLLYPPPTFLLLQFFPLSSLLPSHPLPIWRVLYFAVQRVLGQRQRAGAGLNSDLARDRRAAQINGVNGERQEYGGTRSRAVFSISLDQQVCGTLG